MSHRNRSQEQISEEQGLTATPVSPECGPGPKGGEGPEWLRHGLSVSHTDLGQTWCPSGGSQSPKMASNELQPPVLPSRLSPHPTPTG